jgi:hypothetical protein
MDQEELDQLNADADEGEQPVEPLNIKKLREAANRSDRHKADADAAKRENVFLKAGIDTDSAFGQLMLAGYKGELNAEAVKEYAAQVMPTQGSSNPAPEITQEEIEAHNRRTAIAAGTPAEEIHVPDNFIEQGYTDFHQAMRDGMSRENAAAQVLDRIIDQAVKGNPKALVQGAVTSTARGIG